MLMLYLMDGMPACAQLRIKVCNCFDVAVALRALGEHDGGMLFVIDVAGCRERAARCNRR